MPRWRRSSRRTACAQRRSPRAAARVRAPFAGIVGLTDISVGDLVNNTTAITTLDDLSTVRVDFEVPERWAGRISEGQPITASAQALPGSQFSGKITGIDNRVDATTRTLRLQADLANFGGLLKTGMAIMVSLEFDPNEELAVPSLAVQWDRRGSFVWKIVGRRRAPRRGGDHQAAERHRRRQGRRLRRATTSWSKGCCGSARAPR